ncbi:murein transglycosylase A [Phycisphaerales bacterium AB-hyl4]|uniref:peptidoglycan lytic exotransglycosylase n=1 Tax=Natronomicrosphaera hydrolytica TaxID=3242702 RepID=A0ABV4U767_9BACT
MTARMGIAVLTFIVLSLPLLTVGCQRPVEEPHYNRPLPPGEFGLRRVTDTARMPDLTPVSEQLSDRQFREALDHSLRWYRIPSTPQHFPLGPITHEHAHASAYALKQLGDLSPGDARRALRDEFDVWESVGYDHNGTVFYTGYYSPIFRASRERTSTYNYPLYTRPDDLVADPATGEVKGRQTSTGVVTYPTRAEIEERQLLDGHELVYLSSALDAYLIHVNGSAQLRLADGGTMYVGYAGNNGHEYVSIGALLVKDGHIPEHRLSLPAIREHFRRHPDDLQRYTRRNDRFVFFGEYAGDTWPAGSLGVKVTPMRTLATDKSIFPRGAVVFVETTIPSSQGGTRPFRQLMVDQDTGGAIRAAGRGDIYLGVGEQAGLIAGRQAAEGRLFYLLLKPDRVQHWHDQLRQGDPASVRSVD